MAEARVYGFALGDGRRRIAVKARSVAAVRRAMAEHGCPVSDNQVRNYGTWTGNPKAIAAAEAAGEGVPVQSNLNRHPAKYEPFSGRRYETR